MSDIDRIIATCRRDPRCVSGSERRALCDEIERLRQQLLDVDNALAFWAVLHPIRVLELIRNSRKKAAEAGEVKHGSM